MSVRSISILLAVLTAISCNYKQKLTSVNIQLPEYYQSGMILQTTPVTIIYGKSEPGSTLSVRINDYLQFGKADAEGNWKVEFPTTSSTSFINIIIEGKDTIIRLNEVYPGKLFVLIGDGFVDPISIDQQISVGDSGTADLPNYRYYKPQDLPCETNRKADGNSRWNTLKEASVRNMDMKKLDFISSLFEDKHENYGLIDLTVPGAMPSCWLFDESNASSNRMIPCSDRLELIFNSYLRDTITYLAANSRKAEQKRIHRIWYNDSDWKSIDLPSSLYQSSTPRKRIVYLRKKITIPPRHVTSDFILQLGSVNTDAEFYFNGTQLTPETNHQGLRFMVSDTLIKTYSNVISARMFIKDTQSGIYGNAMFCHNIDSSFYTLINKEWKFSFQLEDDFPEFELHCSAPGILYTDLLKQLENQVMEEVIWFGNLSVNNNPENFPEQPLKILRAFEGAKKRSMDWNYTLTEDSVNFPNHTENAFDHLKDSLTELGLKIYE